MLWYELSVVYLLHYVFVLLQYSAKLFSQLTIWLFFIPNLQQDHTRIKTSYRKVPFYSTYLSKRSFATFYAIPPWRIFGGGYGNFLFSPNTVILCLNKDQNTTKQLPVVPDAITPPKPFFIETKGTFDIKKRYFIRYFIEVSEYLSLLC